MTIADKIPAHDHVVAAGQIDSRLALKILAIEQFAVFHRNVVSLVKLDEIKPIVIATRNSLMVNPEEVLRLIIDIILHSSLRHKSA